MLTMSSTLRSARQNLLDQDVGVRGEGETGLLGEVVAPAGRDPVDLVQPVHRRNARFYRGPAAGLHDARQMVQQAGQIVGVRRIAVLLLAAHPTGQHVPRQFPRGPGEGGVLGVDRDVDRREALARVPVGALVLRVDGVFSDQGVEVAAAAPGAVQVAGGLPPAVDEPLVQVVPVVGDLGGRGQPSHVQVGRRRHIRLSAPPVRPPRRSSLLVAVRRRRQGRHRRVRLHDPDDLLRLRPSGGEAAGTGLTNQMLRNRELRTADAVWAAARLAEALGTRCRVAGR